MADAAARLRPSPAADPPQEETKDFLLRPSGIRCGRNRELDFALKSQSQFASYHGRTRSSCRKDPPNDDEALPSPASDATDSSPAGDVSVISYKRRKKSPEDKISPNPLDAILAGNVLVEKPARRFTRSALKVGESGGAEAEAEAEAVKEEVVDASENEVPDEKTADDAVSPVKTSAKKKLELKMSKKIFLEDIPTGVKELLATGLLEGLRVGYRHRGNKVGVLPGKVKDGGILCSCTSCKGRKVVTAFQFERHAGSSNRYAEQIYLENGNNLRHVLDACKSAPLNMLETIIQSAIGTSEAKKATRCVTCKESCNRSRVGKRPFICKGCRMPKQHQSSLSIRTARLLKQAKGTKTSKSTLRDNLPKKKRGRPPKELVCTFQDNSLESTKTSKSTLRDNLPKKKRGRPPKELVCTFQDNSLGSTKTSKSTLRDNLPKKKRGRPPKELVCTFQDNSLEKNRGCPPQESFNISSDNSLEKKKVCPPKNLVNASKDNSPKRKRGRPPKMLVGTSKDSSLGKRSDRLPKKLVSTSKGNSLEKKRGRPPKKLVITSNDDSLVKKTDSPTKKFVGTSRYKKLQKKGHITKKLVGARKHNNLQKKGRITRKDVRLHKLVFMEDVLPDGTEVGYYSHGKKLLTGYKKGGRIYCCCCNSEVTASQFEAHAGWATRRKPYQYIYTSNGVSLHELSVSLSKGREFSARDNDDLCTICADGGDLLLCDGCPRAFHIACAELSCIPQDDWYCRYCQRMFEKEKFVEYNDNALAAGRVLGVDPIEQITKRCIRIVQTPEADVTVCVLCRCHDFTKSGFGPRTVLLCDQCEKEYHVGCLKEHKMADLKELPKKEWFCCTSCSDIHATLENLLYHGFEKLPDSLSDVIKKKCEGKTLDDGTGLDVRWRLLSGKFVSPDSRFLLSKAVTIFHESFDPIINSTSGKDLIPSMVYGRNTRDQEFGGMFCVVLTVNSTVVCAGVLRIFGQEVAELPLVATSAEKQGQGFFQVLFSCIESLLRSLNVRNLFLPAAEEAESIWTNRFGFKKISQDELSKYAKDSRMMIFQGTSMLHKSILEYQDMATISTLKEADEVKSDLLEPV